MSSKRVDIFEESLLKLRSGELKFEHFAFENNKRFLNLAKYFIRRYSPSGVDEHDLVQEGLIEAWRAVDSWNPDKAPIKKYVLYVTGERMARECRRSLGWPSKGRSSVMRQVDLGEKFEFVANVLGSNNDDIFCKKDTLFKKSQRFCKSDFQRDVFVGIGLGASINVVAAHLYNDSEKRVKYQFISEKKAIAKVRSCVKNLTAILEA